MPRQLGISLRTLGRAATRRQSGLPFGRDVPVSFWRLGETAGTVATDAMGHRDGTIQGTLTSVAGALVSDTDTALAGDGTSSRIVVPNASADVAGGPVSMSGWVKLNASTAGHGGLFGFRNDSSCDFYVLHLWGSNDLECRFRNQFNTEFTLAVTLTPSVWHHIALCYDGLNYLALYIDGKLVQAKDDCFGVLGSTVETFAILGQPGGNYSPDTVDEVKLYNKQLSPETVLAEYSRGRGVARRSVGRLSKRWLGAYVKDAPNTIAALDTYITLVGDTPMVVNWFQDFGYGFVDKFVDTVHSRDAIGMVTWMPSGRSLDQLISGADDAYIRTWAQKAARFGLPLMLRFMHEMNGGWYDWGFGQDHNGNTAAKHITAWRHVHDLFVQEGATNVEWVWCPNVYYEGGTYPIASFYPGDEYVDWMALDGYNWGDGTGFPVQPNTTWATFTQEFGATYADMVAVSAKPIVLGETASAEAGGSKATWITDTFLTSIPTSFPQIKGVCWFHEDKERPWHLDSSVAATNAYKSVVTDPAWQRD